MTRTKMTFVFATAACRIHADILISRLKQAGIPIDLISALYRPQVRPNSAICWLNGSASRSVSSGEKVSIAGLLRFMLGNHQGVSETLAHRLHFLGLTQHQALGLEEALLENHIVVCIQAEDDQELAVTLRTLEENTAENILVGVAETTRGVAASQWAAPHFPIHAARPAGAELAPVF